MYKALAISCMLALAAAACGSNASSATNGVPDTTGGTPGGTDGTTAGDANVLFVIAPIDNNSTISPTDTGPQVANFTVADTMSFQFPAYSGVAGITASIVLNSTANACGDANANAFHVGETQLVLNITDIPDSSIAANTYVFPASATTAYEIASATYAVVQSPCYYNSVSLVSGTVIITDVQPTRLSGSYSLTFASGSVSGTFTNAPTCAAAGLTPASGPVCN